MANPIVEKFRQQQGQQSNPIVERFRESRGTTTVVEPDNSFLLRAKQAIQPTAEGLLSDVKRRDFGQDVLGAIEGRTFGIPRSLIEKASADRIQIPRGSVGGQVFGGLAGGSSLIKGIGKIPLLAQKGKKLLTGGNIARSAGRGALTGAAFSQAPSVTELDTPLPVRLARAGVAGVGGAILSPASELAFGGASGLFNSIRKAKAQPRAIGKSKKQVSRRETEQLEAIDRGPLARKERIVKRELDNAKAEGRKLSQDTEKNTQELERLNADADRKIFLETRKGSVRGQRDIQESLKKGRDTYGERLGKHAKVVNESDTPFMDDELVQVIDETLSEAEKIFVEEGAPVKFLESVRKKFIPEEGTIQVGSKVIDLENVLRFKQLSDKTVSASAKGGTKGFVPEDIVSIIFNKRLGLKIGEKLNQVSPELAKSFAKNQQQYGQLSDLSKDAFRLFKIGKGKSQAPSALVERVAGGKAKPEEMALVRTFERGKGLVPPTKRSITEGTRRAISDKKAVQSQFDKSLTAKETGDAQELLRLKTQNEERVALLNRRLAIAKGRTQVAKKQVSKQAQRDIDRLDRLLEKVHSQNDRINTKLKVLKWVGIGTAAETSRRIIKSTIDKKDDRFPVR